MFVKMRKSLGNKRKKIGDPKEMEPDQIGDITRIHGDCRDGETRPVTDEDPVTQQPRTRERVVSKTFDNPDFGFRKITVERPLRLNFQANKGRIDRIEDQAGFKNLATSSKKKEVAYLEEIALGKARQQEIRDLLATFAEKHGSVLYKNRQDFLSALQEMDSEMGVDLSAGEAKVIVNALSARDETAEICRDKAGNPEPDPELRDTESVPLKEEVETYFRREVLPATPPFADAPFPLAADIPNTV